MIKSFIGSSYAGLQANASVHNVIVSKGMVIFASCEDQISTSVNPVIMQRHCSRCLSSGKFQTIYKTKRIIINNVIIYINNPFGMSMLFHCCSD